MPSKPKHPGRVFVFQAIVGLAMMLTGAAGYAVRNYLDQNPVHVIAGSVAVLALLAVAWRARRRFWMGWIMKLMRGRFERKASGGSKAKAGDFEFDPSAFDDADPTSRAGRDRQRRASWSYETAGDGPGPTGADQEDDETARLAFIRKLDDMRGRSKDGDPKAIEARRQRRKKGGYSR